MNPINDCPRTVPNDYVCNPYCNLGCQRGEHCTISNNVFACVPTGSGELGSPCEQSSDCGHKMACFRITGESVSTCRQFCNSDGECPGERKCELGVNFGSGPHQFCSDIAVGCDPFLDNMAVAGGGGMSMIGGMSMAGGMSTAAVNQLAVSPLVEWSLVEHRPVERPPVGLYNR